MKLFCRLFLILAWGSLAMGLGLANPQGGQVSAGSASIHTGPGNVTINQQSNTAIINWQSFSINQGELTKFVQPSAESATLNRVLGGQISLINGTLSANGQVYLINGNGILVGPGGVINTSGFIGSTRDISDTDFLQGNLHFTGSNTAGVQNFGTITALGGDVVLIGKTVDNAGTINAPKGTAGLAAADDVLINQVGNEHIFVNPTSTAQSASGQVGVNNSGTITAAQAELKAANGNIYALAVQNGGVIRATTVQKQGGHIWLTSDSGTVVNSGTLDASATVAKGQGGKVTVKSTNGTAVQSGTILARGGQGGAGGSADVSGAKVQFTGKVDLTAPGGTTGDLLIDPTMLDVITGGTGTVVGGENDSASTIDPNTVDAALNGADLTLTATDNITISDPLAWSSGNTLTLSTTNPGTNGSTVNINAPITPGQNGNLTIDLADPSDIISTSSAGAISVNSFILQSGNWVQNSPTLPAFSAVADFEIQGTSSFLRVEGGDGSAGNPYQITDIYGLQGLASPSNSYLGASAELLNNIDATPTSSWNGENGFVPIGTIANPYTGTFNGQNYLISNLEIGAGGMTSNYAGVFGVSSGTIENVGLLNPVVLGNNYVGGLVAVNSGNLMNCYASGAFGEVGGNSEVGGLVGENDGMISSSYNSTTVNSTDNAVVSTDIGGLVGLNNGTVQTSFNTGAVTDNVGTGFLSANFVGGLVGTNAAAGMIQTSYSTGSVTVDSGEGVGGQDVGGLVGLNQGTVQTAYSTGTVTGMTDTMTGGLGVTELGGLVGENDATIQTTYSTGAVTGNSPVGGLVGENIATGTILNSYWNMDANPTLTTSGSNTGTITNANGETMANLELQATFLPAGTGVPNWNFTAGTGDWIMVDSQTTPYLQKLSTTISGVTYSDNGVTPAADDPIELYSEGSAAAPVVMSALNGSFSFLVPADQAVSGLLLVDQSGLGYTNNTYYSSSLPLSPTVANINLWGNTLRFLGTGQASNTALTLAAGTRPPGGVLYTPTINGTNGYDLDVPSGNIEIEAPYYLDGNMVVESGTFTTTAAGSLTVFNPETISTIESAAGDITLTGTVYNSGTLDLESNSLVSLLGTVTSPGSLTLDATTLDLAAPLALGGTLMGTATTVNVTGAVYDSGSITLNGGDGGGISVQDPITGPGTLALDTPTLDLDAPITLGVGAITGTAIMINVSANGLVQNATAAASSSDSATINLAANATYELTSEVLINTNLTINGNGAILDGSNGDGPGNGVTRVMEIDGTAQGIMVNLDNLTLENGNGVDAASAGVAGTAYNGSGGGLLVYVPNGDQANVTINDSTISGNTISTNGLGGGIYNSGTLMINDSTVSGNSVGNQGGGIYNSGYDNNAMASGTAALTINNSTISGNNAIFFGGAIENDADEGVATVTVNSSTISGNSAGSSGGGIYNVAGGGTATLTLDSTILAGNTVDGEESDYTTIGGTLADNGYNLLGNDGILTSNGTTDILLTASIDTVLNPTLANNGGPTETLALVANSPAIEAGDPAYIETMDQRGVLRGDAASSTGTESDIGAYEAAIIQVTANNQEITYGQSLPTLTYTVNSGPSADLAGALGLITPATNAGTYTGDIGPGTLVSTNSAYVLDLTPGTLVIDKAALTVAVNAGGSSTYGTAPTDPGIGVTSGALYNGDTLSSLGLGDDFALTATSNAGTYPVNVTGATGVTNYTVTTTSSSFTINPAVLTYTANAASRTYGAADPALSGTVTGFVLGQTQGTATTGTLTFTGTDAATSNVGSYAINGSGLTANNGNYTFVQAAGNMTALSVTPAALSVAVNGGGNSTYGTTPTDPGIEVTAGTLFNGDTLSSLGLGDDFALTAASNAGTYPVNVTGATGVTNYTVTTTGSSFTINPAVLIYTANAASRTYGAADPALSGTVTGFVLGQTQGTATTGTLSFTGNDAATSNVGSYAINGSGLTANNGNYTFVQAAANATALSVTPATLSVAVNGGGNSTYGTTPTDPGIGVTAGTLFNGDTLSSLGLGDDFALTAASNAGTYPVNVTGATGVTNYTVTTTSSSFTINPAVLTYTANAASRTYGAADPALSGTVTGFVLGQTQGTATTGTLTFTGTDAATSNVGSYAINGSGLTANNGNYTFAQAAANATALSVTPAALSVAVNGGGNSTYGTAPTNPGIEVTAGTLFNGDTLSSLGLGDDFALTATSDAGTYPVNVTGATGVTNYTVTTSGSSYTVNPAPLTVTANNFSEVYNGAAYSGGNGVTYNSFVNGENPSVLGGTLTYGGNSQGAVNVGSYLITPSGLTSQNYAITYNSGTLQITPPLVRPTMPAISMTPITPQVVNLITSVIATTANLPVPTTIGLGLTPPPFGIDVLSTDDASAAGGAINDGSANPGFYIAIGSSTSDAPALYHLLTAEGGTNIIYNGIVGWVKPPTGLLNQFENIFSTVTQNNLLYAASHTGLIRSTATAAIPGSFGKILLLTPQGGIVVISNGVVISEPPPSLVLDQFSLIFNAATQNKLHDATFGSH